MLHISLRFPLKRQDRNVCLVPSNHPTQHNPPPSTEPGHGQPTNNTIREEREMGRGVGVPMAYRHMTQIESAWSTYRQKRKHGKTVHVCWEPAMDAFLKEMLAGAGGLPENVGMTLFLKTSQGKTAMIRAWTLKTGCVCVSVCLCVQPSLSLRLITLTRG